MKQENKDMHRALRLQHHKHTGKVLHHKHTSYRALALLLVLTGAILLRVEWSMQKIADADDLAVSAVVPATTPTQAATIDQPVDGSIVTDPNISVSGTCQVLSPAVIVVIYSGSTILGSTGCQPDGTFQLQVTLLPGINTLIARTVNITNQYGPDSAPITVTYNAPTPPPTNPTNPVNPPSHGGGGTSTGGSTGSGGSPAGPLQPLVIEIDEPFLVFGPNKAAEWTGHITGGQTPYTVTIDWGDGSTTTYRNQGTGELRYNHTYKTLESHTVNIDVTDPGSNHTHSTYVAVTPYTSPTVGNILRGNMGGGISNYTVFAFYWAYFALLCAFGAIWLRRHRYSYAKVPVANRQMVVVPDKQRKQSGGR